MLKDKHKLQQEGGFTILEVLVTFLIVTAFSLISMQLTVISAFIRVKAQIENQAGIWIDDNISESKHLATQVLSDNSKCLASSFSNGYAQALLTEIDTTYPINTKEKEILGVTYRLERTYDTVNSDAPHKMLKVLYKVRKWNGSAYTGDPVAEGYAEIVPNAAFQCQ